MNQSNPTQSTRPPLTPEVVKKVADKVYAMLLADLRLEQERGRRTGRQLCRSKGGR